MCLLKFTLKIHYFIKSVTAHYSANYTCDKSKPSSGIEMHLDKEFRAHEKLEEMCIFVQKLIFVLSTKSAFKCISTPELGVKQ